MTRDDILRMAREAGAHDNGWEVRFVEPRYFERFAALVAAAAKAEEREACAKACETAFSQRVMTANAAGYVGMAVRHCAAAIRARGEK